MKLFLLTTLTMFAFAANSLLNRLALLDGAIGPAGFATIRVVSGVVVLVILLALRDKAMPKPSKPKLLAVAGLSLYMLGFSFAYVSMDAGLGALVLFGGVQLVMFFGALIEGERPSLQKWIGLALAVAGLVLLTLPNGPIVIAPLALVLMALAAIGWGVYSLIGRGTKDPIAATSWNFIYSVPIVFAAFMLWPDTTSASTNGIMLAIVSGGVTSALGYALWYALLPKLGATRGALAQLSAPAIAMAMGALLLGESITTTALIAAAMILGGIAVGLVPKGRE